MMKMINLTPKLLTYGVAFLIITIVTLGAYNVEEYLDVDVEMQTNK